MFRDWISCVGDIAYLSRAILRALWRTLRGLRGPGWHDSPLHDIADAGLRRATHRTGARYAYMAMISAAVLKFRELAYTDKLNHVIRVGDQLDQKRLRNFVALQRQIIERNPELAPQDQVNLSLLLGDDLQGAARLMDMVVLFCLSERTRNLSLHWDAAVLERDISLSFSAAERSRRNGGNPDLYLAGPDAGVLQSLEQDGEPRAFRALVDGRKRASDYFKCVAPGRMVLALCLAENNDGMVQDGQEQSWLPTLETLHRQVPELVVCLLNCVSLRSAARFPDFIHPVRGQGFSLLETVAIAQHADAYCGPLDMFGLAALGRQRPGLYFSLDGATEIGWDEAPEPQIDLTRGIARFAYVPDATEVADTLRELLVALREPSVADAGRLAA